MTSIEIIQNYECATFIAREATYKELMAVLLVSGYGVAQSNRSSMATNKGRTLLVVNMKFDPKFWENLADLSEYYDQNTFVYSPDDEKTQELAERLGEKLQLDTFDKYSVNGKQAIHYYAWQTKVRREKERRKAVIEGAIKEMNSDRYPCIFFDNEDYSEFHYWYDMESDSLVTDYASIRFDCETDKINTCVIDKMLYKLEDMLTDYFKKNYGVTLLSIDD